MYVQNIIQQCCLLLIRLREPFRLLWGEHWRFLPPTLVPLERTEILETARNMENNNHFFLLCSFVLLLVLGVFNFIGAMQS